MWENISAESVFTHGLAAGLAGLFQWIIFFYKQKRDSDLKDEITKDRAAIEAYKDINSLLRDDLKILKGNVAKLEECYFEEREENIKLRLENDDWKVEVAKLQKQLDNRPAV